MLTTTGPAGLDGDGPERVSVTVNENDTFVLFQPAALATGLAAPNVTTGGVLSSMTGLKPRVAELPALSMHVLVTPPLLVSTLNTVELLVGLPKATPERLSVQEKVTVTSLLVQVPAA
jgi:hypothetical protein